MIFDPAVIMIFDPIIIMTFDPAGNNKFDHAITQDIRPSTSRFFNPCGAEDFARHTLTPRSQCFDDYSDR
jgi:hypothetical protein